jgi:hypothetical protein
MAEMDIDGDPCLEFLKANAVKNQVCVEICIGTAISSANKTFSGTYETYLSLFGNQLTSSFENRKHGS